MSLSQIHTLPVLDYITLQENTFGEPPLLQELLHLYEEDMNERLKKLHQAWRSQDMGACYFEVHSMKGSSGSIGARQLEAIAVAVLFMLKDNNLHDCEPYLSLLTPCYEAFLAEIRDIEERGFLL